MIRRDLSLALEALFEGGHHTFWEAYEKSPVEAIKVFMDEPNHYGAIDRHIVGVLYKRLFGRAVKLMSSLSCE